MDMVSISKEIQNHHRLCLTLNKHIVVHNK